jgi:hypothetical protein
MISNERASSELSAHVKYLLSMCANASALRRRRDPATQKWYDARSVAEGVDSAAVVAVSTVK